MRLRNLFVISHAVLACWIIVSVMAGVGAASLEEEYAPGDMRLGVMRANNQFYAFPHFDSKRAWLERRLELRDRIRVSMGCFPALEKTPLNAQIFDRLERDGYTVEKAYFESLPGFFVTGNLYRPLDKPGPHPGMISVHGHWGPGRFTHEETNSIPGRAINLARQGYVVFSYDMIGYNDAMQLQHNWGGESEWLWGLSSHGLHFWNSVRALDFLLTLDDVDPERIGVTGASGGGTQAYMLMAVDERVAAAAPVNMISSHFQGGCICENAPGLRLDAFNTEFAAMMAPRPLLLISTTGDWTRETPWQEYPAVRSVYSLYDVEDRLETMLADAPHNYNRESREAAYAFFARNLLGRNVSHIEETPYELDPPEALRVFPNGVEDMPAHAIDEEELRSWWKAESERQLRQIYPESELQLNAMRHRGRTALKHILGAKLPHPNDLRIQRVDYLDSTNYVAETYIIGRIGQGDRIPAVMLTPKGWKGGRAAVVAHEEGMVALFNSGSQTQSSDTVSALLENGIATLLIDVFQTGEHLALNGNTARSRDAAHFLTYNPSDAALRVQDILTGIAFLDARFDIESASLIGLGKAGLWSLLAAALAPGLEALAVDACEFDLDDDAQYLNELFIPGLRRAGDLRLAQALAAPTPLLLHRVGDRFDTNWARQSYRTAGVENRLTIQRGGMRGVEVVDWLNRALR